MRDRSQRLLHRVKGKVGPGLYNIQHPEDCECGIVISPPHALWVTYQQIYGYLQRNRCYTKIQLPCPIKLTWPLSKEGYMDIEAIQDELLRFAGRHENCREETQLGLLDAPAS